MHIYIRCSRTIIQFTCPYIIIQTHWYIQECGTVTQFSQSGVTNFLQRGFQSSLSHGMHICNDSCRTIIQFTQSYIIMQTHWYIQECGTVTQFSQSGVTDFLQGGLVIQQGASFVQALHTLLAVWDIHTILTISYRIHIVVDIPQGIPSIHALRALLVV